MGGLRSDARRESAVGSGDHLLDALSVCFRLMPFERTYPVVEKMPSPTARGSLKFSKGRGLGPWALSARSAGNSIRRRSLGPNAMRELKSFACQMPPVHRDTNVIHASVVSSFAAPRWQGARGRLELAIQNGMAAVNYNAIVSVRSKEVAPALV